MVIVTIKIIIVILRCAYSSVCSSPPNMLFVRQIPCPSEKHCGWLRVWYSV